MVGIEITGDRSAALALVGAMSMAPLVPQGIATLLARRPETFLGRPRISSSERPRRAVLGLATDGCRFGGAAGTPALGGRDDSVGRLATGAVENGDGPTWAVEVGEQAR